MVSEKSSQKHVFCADYLKKHKKATSYQRNFRSIQDVDIVFLKSCLPEGCLPVREADFVCGSCSDRFKELTAELSETSVLKETFVPEQGAAVEELSRYVESLEVSPLKPLSSLSA